MTDEPQAHTVTPEQLITAIPAMLGYIPTESVIVIHGTEDGKMQGAVRIPVTADKDEMAEVAEALEQLNPGGSCVVVLISTRPRAALEAMSRLGEELTIGINEVFASPSLEQGSEFMSLMNPEVRGRLPDWRDSSITTQVVSEGKRIFDTEEQIHELFYPSEPTEPCGKIDIEECGQTLAMVGNRIRNPRSSEFEIPSPGAIGSALIWGDNARFFAIGLIKINAQEAYEIFANAAKFIRGKARVEALTLAGIAAFINSDGSLASGALKAAWDTALLMDPPFKSDLLEATATAYYQGVKSEDFERIIFQSIDEGDQT